MDLFYPQDHNTKLNMLESYSNKAGCDSFVTWMKSWNDWIEKYPGVPHQVV